MKKTSPAPTPARRRVISTAAVEKQPTAALIQLAAKTFVENAAQNKAGAAYKKTRVELFKKMKEEGFSRIDAIAQIGEKQVPLIAEIATPSVNYIDVAVLQKLVSAEIFLKIVTASQAGVTEHAGAGIAAEALRTGTGTENVSVRVLK